MQYVFFFPEMARQIQKQKKLVLLEKILEKKQILFAPFSDSITHEMKDAAWQEVLLVAQSQTLVNEGRDWTFVRDKIWSKLKSKALVSYWKLLYLVYKFN